MKPASRYRGGVAEYRQLVCQIIYPTFVSHHLPDPPETPLYSAHSNASGTMLLGGQFPAPVPRLSAPGLSMEQTHSWRQMSKLCPCLSINIWIQSGFGRHHRSPSNSRFVDFADADV